ncbi:DUF6048 family protein [Mangrovibacterium diazotrophicum]|uniref:Outer membrane protein with beta-barrel domain n=1 Tax=Mangrovibacterium diazotrophicum TaxID=1261403 RepID=A0A419W7T3_9BACT|nr:DUF6048 family protein [Mangrovibacterium diazotrophicum]RKD91533.1 hypothetical protein BC643_1889 [Mangrovibacterium diazotrophicum]
MKIFNYTLTIALILLSLSSWAQEKEKKKMPKRTDNYIHMPGIRIGFDLTRPYQNLWTKGDRYGSEFSGDIELKPNLYGAVEIGWEKFKMNHAYVDYESAGSYTRIGIDYNLLTTESADERDIFYVGLRYGFGAASQTVNSYSFDDYWGDTSGSFPKQNFTSHWMEVVLGLKGEILKNFYMGWSVRAKFMLAQKDFDIPPIYFTSGFGKSEGGVTLDFTYSVYYTLPFKFRSESTK